MTVCLIKSLQKLPYMHCIDMSLANPRYTLYSHSHVLRHGRVRYTVTQFEFTCTEAPSSWSFMLQNCRKRSGCICNAVYASYKNYQYAELGNICRASLPPCHTTPLILYILLCHPATLHLWFSTLFSATLTHYTSDSLHSPLPHCHTTNRKCTPYMTVCMEFPCWKYRTYTIYTYVCMVLVNPTYLS